MVTEYLNHKDYVNNASVLLACCGIMILQGCVVPFGNTDGFYWAVRNNDLSYVEEAIAKQRAPQDSWRFPMPPLQIAADMNHLDIAKLLIEKNGTDVDYNRPSGKTYLVFYSEPSEEIKVMAKEKKYVTVKGPLPRLLNRPTHSLAGLSDSITALHIAAYWGNFEMVQYLVGEGADIDALTDYLDTPVYLAWRSNRLQIVKWLIENGADVSAGSLNHPDFESKMILYGYVKPDQEDVVSKDLSIE